MQQTFSSGPRGIGRKITVDKPDVDFFQNYWGMVVDGDNSQAIFGFSTAEELDAFIRAAIVARRHRFDAPSPFEDDSSILLDQVKALVGAQDRLPADIEVIDEFSDFSVSDEFDGDECSIHFGVFPGTFTAIRGTEDDGEKPVAYFSFRDNKAGLGRLIGALIWAYNQIP